MGGSRSGCRLLHRGSFWENIEMNNPMDDDLFSHAAARRTDPETSVEAAKSLLNGQATEMEQIVLSALRGNPEGLTTHEMSDLTGVQLVSISPRIKPLLRKGLIRDSFERRTGISGRKSIVWKLLNNK